MASKQSPSGKKLMAKATHLVYGFPGELMVGWEAHPAGLDKYEIVRHDGSRRVMSVGEQIKVRERGGLEPSTSIVNRSESGVLMVGNKSVLIGAGLKHGYQARALAQRNTYLLLSDQKHQLGKVTIGDHVDGQSVCLVDGHLLKVGENIYPIVPKQREITLLVMGSSYEGGYLSYVNIVEKGNMLNRKDGTMGALIPPKNEGEPALFTEVYGGKMVVTARFWVESNGRKLGYQFRDGETALHELVAEEALNNARKIAIETGIEPEEYAEYIIASERLDAFKDQWEKEGMSLILGEKYFRPHDPRKELEDRGLSF